MTVSGDYVKSSFGSSLDALCRLTVPIRDLCDGSIIKLEKGQPASEIPEIKVCARQIKQKPNVLSVVTCILNIFISNF